MHPCTPTGVAAALSAHLPAPAAPASVLTAAAAPRRAGAQAVAKQRNQLVLFGGQAPAEVRGPAKYEGRRVGMDFFQSPRGPPW